MDKLTTHKLADGREIAFVPYPSWAIDHGLRDNGTVISFGFDNGISRDYTSLPQGNWRIIGVSDQMSEEVAKLLSVDFVCPNQWCENGYIDQGYNEKWRCNYCQDQEDSETPNRDAFASLLRSLGLNTTKRYVLIEKLKS